MDLHWASYGPDNRLITLYTTPDFTYLSDHPSRGRVVVFSHLTRSTSADSLRYLATVTRGLTWVPTAGMKAVDTSNTDDEDSPKKGSDSLQETAKSNMSIVDLPVEIQENILSYVFGKAGPPYSRPVIRKTTMTYWLKAGRYGHRKELAELALVSRVWMILVQKRVYANLRIEATRSHFAECVRWLDGHPHLSEYVRSIEFWWPVKARRKVSQVPHGMTEEDVYFGPRDHKFYLTGHESSVPLDKLLSYVKLRLSNLRTLVLDGGHCKNSILINHFSNRPLSLVQPVVPQVNSLILRGSWNLARTWPHVKLFFRALPNLEEWDCSYWPFTINVHHLMARTLRELPSALRHLTLSFENLTDRSDVVEDPKPTLCPELGKVAARLESLTLAGRICGRFFTALIDEVLACGGESRLHTLTISVEELCKDCAQPREVWEFQTSESDWAAYSYLQDFQAVTQGAMYALEYIPSLRNIHIRALEIDSGWFMMSPYFQYKGGAHCKGFWSFTLIDTLASVREGSISYLSTEDGIYPDFSRGQIAGVLMPPRRPDSLSMDAYMLLRGDARFEVSSFVWGLE